jgi:hypothetical protein
VLPGRVTAKRVPGWPPGRVVSRDALDTWHAWAVGKHAANYDVVTAIEVLESITDRKPN